jgi:hypothetical protein
MTAYIIDRLVGARALAGPDEQVHAPRLSLCPTRGHSVSVLEPFHVPAHVSGDDWQMHRARLVVVAGAVSSCNAATCARRRDRGEHTSLKNDSSHSIPERVTDRHKDEAIDERIGTGTSRDVRDIVGRWLFSGRPRIRLRLSRKPSRSLACSGQRNVSRACVASPSTDTEGRVRTNNVADDVL